jgi:hypothetical protein
MHIVCPPSTGMPLNDKPLPLDFESGDLKLCQSSTEQIPRWITNPPPPPHSFCLLTSEIVHYFIWNPWFLTPSIHSDDTLPLPTEDEMSSETSYFAFFHADDFFGVKVNIRIDIVVSFYLSIVLFVLSSGRHDSIWLWELYSLFHPSNLGICLSHWI